MRRAAQVVYGNQNWATAIQGLEPGALEVRDWGLVDGRNFSEQDVRNATKVCLLGQTVVDSLFGSMDPVGQIVRIRKIPFVVIGVLEKNGQSPIGQDQDDVVFIPITTALKKVFGTTHAGTIGSIMVKAVSTEALPERSGR